MMIGYEPFAKEEKPSTLDVAAAAFRIENPVSAWVESLYYKSEEEDQEGYNPFDGLDSKYLMFSEEFEDVRSPGQREMKMAQIDSQLRDREVMARGGARTFGWTMVAGLTDPVNFPLLMIPAGAAIRAGASAARTGMVVAAGGASEAVVSETLLHETQPTRTWQESLFAVGGTALLGGSLGALAGAGAKRTQKAIIKAEEDIESIVKDGGLSEIPTELSAGDAGAARVIGSLEEEGSDLLGPSINPGIGLLKSPVATSRLFVNETWRHNFFNGKNKITEDVTLPDGTVVKGSTGTESSIPVDVENTRMFEGMGGKYVRTIQEQYQEMLGTKTLTGARLSGRFGSNMRMNQFAEEIGRAMRRNDEHDIPQVAAAARKIRKDVIDPITKEHQAIGDLPGGIQPKF
ncbi:MAG: hypothetical protein KJO91_01515, partial [Gammaproteobacteria bacterium]|nr:hypothetical protein [Gammaproteobacteria bacterium]